MERVKIGEKTWHIAVMPNSTKFFTANVFYCMVRSRKVFWEKSLEKFTLFEYLATIFGELIDQPKGY